MEFHIHVNDQLLNNGFGFLFLFVSVSASDAGKNLTHF